MWQAITDKFNNWFDSFNNQDSGWSRKKLIAFAIAWLCYIKAHFVYFDYAVANKDFSLLPTILGIDAGLITTLLGITALQQYANKKIDNNGNDNSTTEQPKQ